MFALADANTTRLLRALSLAGPASVKVLAEELALHPTTVRDILTRTTALGVVRPHPGPSALYELDAEAVRAAVNRNRNALLGATA